jgi:integrase
MHDVLTATLKAVRMNMLADALVSCSHKGTSYRSFRAVCEPAVRKARIEDFAFRDLRHIFARRLVMAGVDLPTVQALLGHTDITLTRRGIRLSPVSTSSEPSEHLSSVETTSQQCAPQIVPGIAVVLP